MQEILAELLKQATRKGATAADAFVVEDQSFSAQVRLGQVDTVKHAREQHMREIHTVNEWVDVRDLVLTAGLVVETVRLNAAV